MAINDNILTQLYSVALEEARNHSRLYAQTWIAALATSGVALGTLVFLFRSPSFVPSGFIIWAIIGMSFFIGLFFYHSIAYHAVEGHKCRAKAKEIGLILMSEVHSETPNLEELLVTEVTTEFRSPRDRRAYTLLVNPPWRLFWFFVPVGLWILLFLLLAGCIG